MVKILPLFLLASGCVLAADKPFHSKEDIFPPEATHNHASSLLELPNGDLFVCWYRGSGERQADDVQVMASRLKKGAKTWTPRYVLADTPEFPDTNPTLFLDSKNRVWLFYQAIVANQWETAITKMRTTARWQADPLPWDETDILLVKPRNMAAKTAEVLGQWPAMSLPMEMRKQRLLSLAADKYFSRMGWMTRAHPTQLASGRILLPLYSDGYSFGMVALSDDMGRTWQASEPIVGAGGIQPSIAARKDGTLVAYLRDNGPAPKRVQVSYSKDNGLSWTGAVDTDIPNSGTGLEVRVLKDGKWAFINNDTETNRHSLALWLSDDEGLTWKWKRHLELEPGGRFHYPSLVQGRDGSLHASYSAFRQNVKTIRHAHFNIEWVMEGDK